MNVDYLSIISKSTLIAALSTISNYTLTIFLAREGVDGNFAFYMYCFTWSAILNSIVNFASEQVFMQNFMKTNSIERNIRVVFTLRAFLMLIIIILWGAFSQLLAYDLPSYTLLMLIPALNLGVVFEYYQKNVSYVFFVFFERIALLFFMYLTITTNGFSGSVYWVYFFVTGLSLLFQIKFIKNYVGDIKLFGLGDVKDYVYNYWPMFVVVQAQLGYGYFSRLIIEYKKGLEDFASAALALQIVNLVVIYQVQIERVFRNRIIRAITSEDRIVLKELITHYILYSTLLIAFVVLILIIMAESIVSFVFPLGYENLALSVEILSPLMLTINLSRLCDIIWTGLGNHKFNMKLTIIMVSVLLVLLSLNSSDDITTYLATIVIIQFLHVTISISYAYSTYRGRWNDQLV